MIKVKGIDNYDGGKSGDGTYQKLINRIPPLKHFYSLYAGNCGVTRNIKLAPFMRVNDLDPLVYNAWLSSDLPVNFSVTNEPAIFAFSLIPDTSDRFIFLDPTYLIETRKCKSPLYRFQMDVDDHLQLLSAITGRFFNKIMICSYPNDIYDDALAGWETFDYMSMTHQGMVNERIYMNYKLDGKLHDYSFIGDDYRDREALKRVKDNYIKKFHRLSPYLQNSILNDLRND